MSAPLPRVQHGTVLAGVKATPSGWPPASPDPSSGRRPPAATGSGIQQNQVSTVPGDCHKAGEPVCCVDEDLWVLPGLGACAGHASVLDNWG
jgi:hypothetical protein